MPSSPSAAENRGERLRRLIAKPFAHRGRHGPGLAENSLAAFSAAIEAGEGIELDVQRSADDQAIVFHDERLERLTDGEGLLVDLPAAALRRIRLRGTDSHIPTLAEALAMIGNRAGLLIEIKAPARQVEPLCAAVENALLSHPGEAAIMSFNPEVGRWFSGHAPNRLRGLVVTESGRPWRGHLFRHLAILRAKPDFLAYDIRDLPSAFAIRMRRRGLPILTWTCRSLSERERAKVHADQIIHEVGS